MACNSDECMETLECSICMCRMDARRLYSMCNLDDKNFHICCRGCMYDLVEAKTSVCPLCRRPFEPENGSLPFFETGVVVKNGVIEIDCEPAQPVQLVQPVEPAQPVEDDICHYFQVDPAQPWLFRPETPATCPVCSVRV